jgi:hypothetical protein
MDRVLCGCQDRTGSRQPHGPATSSPHKTLEGTATSGRFGRNGDVTAWLEALSILCRGSLGTFASRFNQTLGPAHLESRNLK